MTDLPEVTLVCADCAYHDLSAQALARSMRECRFGRAVLFTDREIALDRVETVRIASLRSVPEYSDFILKVLADHVNTSHALVIQWDGFVLDGGAWRAEFLDYDYIGAVWPDEKDAHRVGNGGFSLRSKRLLEALRDPSIRGVHSEDYVICRLYRPMLEARYGIRFAPEDVARRFSFELEPAAGAVFGFHGVLNLGSVYRDDAELLALVARLPDRSFFKREIAQLKDRLRELGRGAAAAEVERRWKAATAPVIAGLLSEGLRRHLAGDFHGAEETYEKALRIDNRHPDALHLLGALYGASGRIGRALALLGLALQANDRAAAYHETLATLRMAQGDRAGALDSLRAAAALEPGNADRQRALAEALVPGNAPTAQGVQA